MRCGNKVDRSSYSERGNGASPLQDIPSATSKPPGKTGTGAPVTEQLRCRISGKLGWYRDSSRPYFVGAAFIFDFIMEVNSYGKESIRRK